jgi:hypothetical protein
MTLAHGKKIAGLALFLWIGTQIGNAQGCAEFLQGEVFKCIYESCRGSVLIQFPKGGEDQAITCGPVECCGQLITTCDFNGDSCSDARLRDAAVRQSLDRIASRDEVLVADCNGRYSVYAPRPRRDHADVFVLRDDALR